MRCLAKEPVAGGGLSADVDSEYMELDWADEVIGQRARYADLTIVGPLLLADSDLKRPVLNGTLFQSGKPILLVPEGCRPKLRPERVLVAWDSRLEAARAVGGGRELLGGADELS